MRRLLLPAVLALAGAGCGGGTKTVTVHAPAAQGAARAVTAGCSGPAGICSAVHSPGIAPRPVNGAYARSVQDALEIAPRDDLAAALYNLLHAHHRHVSVPSCRQAAVLTCSVWVTPIREQLSIAIACQHRGSGTSATVTCHTQPLDLIPAQALQDTFPATSQLVASHGWTLAGERCDNPWDPPRAITDPQGLQRMYHCLLAMVRPGAPVFDARAQVYLALGLSGGGWQIHVLDTPGGSPLHHHGTLPKPALIPAAPA